MNWCNRASPRERALLQAKGLVSFNAIAHALNKRDIPTALGGRWHQASVRRLLERLESIDRASRSQHRR
jgi:hypothetical protein